MKQTYDRLILQHVAVLHDMINRDNSAPAKGLDPVVLQPLAEVLQLQNQEEPGSDSAETYTLKMMHYQLDLLHASFMHARRLAPGETPQSRFLLLFAEMYELLGKSTPAAACYTELIDQSADSVQLNLKGTALLKMGQLLAEQGKLPEAEESLTRAKITLENAGNIKSVISAEIELAQIAYRRGEYLQAEGLFRQALEHLSGIDDKYHEAVILNHLGVIARLHGKLERARTNLQEALVCFQSVNDRNGEAESWNNLGRVYFQQENTREALNCFEKAAAICRATGAEVLKAFIQLNKCELYLEIQDIPLAVATSKNALEIFVRLRNPAGFARTCKMLGTIARASGKEKFAAQCYESSICFYRDLRIPFGLVAALMDYAGFLLDTGRKKEVRKILDEAEKIKNVMQLQQAVSSNAFDALDKNLHRIDSVGKLKDGSIAAPGAN